MKKNFRNKFRKISAVFLAAAFIFVCLPKISFASGSYYTSVSSMTLTQGSSSSFTFGASSAVGAFEISTDGGVSASCSSEKWVDNSSVTISVTGNTVGTGHVYISVYDGADYDGNDLSGKSYTVTVTVKASSTTQATTAATTTETTTEETTADPELELLSVTVDGTQMYVVKDISDEELPDGFEIEETVYNTVTVQVMVYEDIVLYILENETGGTGYYTYNEETGEFEVLKYTTLSGKFCIFLDIPDTLEIPYGYSVVETEICGFTVEALAIETEDESESETESETESESGTEAENGSESEVEMISFFTVGESLESTTDENEIVEEEDAETGEDDDSASGDISDDSGDITSIDQMIASSSGHYYVYCLLGEEKVLCDYDSEDDILQRCAAIVAVEEDAVTEVETVAEDTEEENIDINLILLIDVIIACVIIVILVIVLIIVIIVKKKNKKNPEFVDDIDFEEEDIFYGEEKDQSGNGSGFDMDRFFEENIERDIKIEDGSSGDNPLEDEPESGVSSAGEPEADASEGDDISEDEGHEPVSDKMPEDDLGIEDITEILSEEFDRMLKEEGEL